ncbi:MAG: mannose-1-phosphate guanylyltransferase [Anaerolineales bacterium]|nr:mannose-1-phosphate guanylyltransferase [Anaerolineales bacterium]
MDNYFAVIMAGGGGTRLWPLSRQKQPKQAIQLLGERTLYQIAVDRLLPLFSPERILVVTSGPYAELLHAQRPAIPPANFIIEPAPRGTAPALGLAALTVRHRHPQGVMACVTADHFIRDEEKFRALLVAAAQVAERNFLVTLGIEPTFASTGFGYIQRDSLLGTFNGFDVYFTARFKEKPPQAEAEKMVADGQHSWNSGMFVWKAEKLMEEFAWQMPGFHHQLTQIENGQATLEAVWPNVLEKTIDYGVMEGAEQVAIIPASGLGWNDVGSWDALLEVMETDSTGNVAFGTELLAIDTKDTLVHNSNSQRKLIATLGVSDLVIVDTGDVLLVCPRDKTQAVRDLVAALKKRGDGNLFL